jgi:ABC-2 type transport system ATP-binding protein
MISTHIMQEVEAVCDRVIIINNGSITANGSITELKKQTLTQIVMVEFDTAMVESSLKKIEGVTQAKLIQGTTWQIQAHEGGDLRKEIFNYAVANNAVVLSLNRQEQKMEDVFKEKTKGV